jgi:hypothetical protein
LCGIENPQYVCYFYLYDVRTDPLQLGDLSYLFDDGATYEEEEEAESRPSILEIAPQLSQSRWFTGGWTLQELLAPTLLQLFDRDWAYLGSGQDLVDAISSITKIQTSVLRKTDGVGTCSVGCRRSWAATRATTRIEGEAYCLLGIFGVTMPLLYGESRRAFARLQKEIIRVSNDQSILAWKGVPPPDFRFPVEMRYGESLGEALADRVGAFANCGYYNRVFHPIAQNSIEVTVKGVEATARVVKRRHGTRDREYALLDCIDERNPAGLLALGID